MGRATSDNVNEDLTTTEGRCLGIQCDMCVDDTCCTAATVTACVEVAKKKNSVAFQVQHTGTD